MEPLTKILIIADETPFSEKVIQYGYLVANQMQARVGLLLVDDSKLHPIDTVMPYETIYGDNTFMHAKHFLESMREKYALGIDTKIFVVEGEIKETVISTSLQWNAQLIVAGTHARRGISKFFMGSISEGILHETTIPMLIVPVNKME
ncbi:MULTISPECIES: universal stress protein [Chryseobacterium]|uniref:Universal stress protein UspE n=2 Tax=Chryseobacterium gleum TaxID=250 RepID=A0A448B913_CHRGE|nr:MULTISPECIES: universal stress protein [Chryseobacterium]HAF35312.1 universal stress protein [Sphingobacterium sp.]EFK36136.1 universal stress family protein [Chryseobacterium gleum ATCC 35910]QQY31834.1 universal stress protein [Chryseobacterium gleum]UMQ43154.1 universal stress protein [Chryseobacterium sp. Y16C]VEE11059.1 universal stress protein UspE [Chryseobacterium gleum]